MSSVSDELLYFTMRDANGFVSGYVNKLLLKQYLKNEIGNISYTHNNIVAKISLKRIQKSLSVQKFIKEDFSEFLV